jgi:hypothetical protein
LLTSAVLYALVRFRRTIAKVAVMGSSYMDELLQEIDYDMLPGTVLLVVLG